MKPKRKIWWENRAKVVQAKVMNGVVRVRFAKVLGDAARLGLDWKRRQQKKCRAGGWGPEAARNDEKGKTQQ